MTRILERDVHGNRALVLENDRISATVLPDSGGRIWELWDKPNNRQWIWHRPGHVPGPATLGSNYDDVWAGGWEELFPNDAPGVFEGKNLPDHGEWWLRPWRVVDELEGEEIRLTVELTVRHVVCEKVITLPSHSDTLTVRYRIRSQESSGFHFLFKQHLPLALNSDCRLVLPGGRVTAVDPSFGTLVGTASPFEWPIAPSRVDLSEVPYAASASREFVYVDDLAKGWCGCDDPIAKSSLRLSFDKSQLPFVWLFLTYGGWRECYTAVLEPCTNMPKDLAEAVRRGTSAFLAPNDLFETTVALSLRDYAKERE